MNNNPTGTHDRNGREAARDPEAEHYTLELVEEELQPHVERIEKGEVAISKRVVTETETISVPVKREELVVERKSGSGKATSDRDSLHGKAERGDLPAGEVVRDLEPGEEMRIPLRKEEVRVEKVPVVAEEAVIGKRGLEETKKVQDVVLREVAVAETEGQVHVHGDVAAIGSVPTEGPPPVSPVAVPPAPAATASPRSWYEPPAVRIEEVHATKASDQSRGATPLLLGAAAAATGALGSTWWYRHRQRKRRRPLDRLRRQARSLGNRALDEVATYVMELDSPERAGRRGALPILAGLMLGLALRRGNRREEMVLVETAAEHEARRRERLLEERRERRALARERAREDVALLREEVLDRIPFERLQLPSRADLAKTSLKASTMLAGTSLKAANRAREVELPEVNLPWRTMGIAAGLAALFYLIVRLVRGAGDQYAAPKPSYIGTPGVESALGRDRTLTGELPREMGTERSVH